jgi:hypothetical protein
VILEQLAQQVILEQLDLRAAQEPQDPQVILEQLVQ